MKDFRSLCGSELIASSACHVYVDLINNPARQYADVTYKYNEEIESIILIAKKKVTVNGEEVISTDYIIPHAACHDIDLHKIEKIQDILCPNEPKASIILAILDSNTTIMYYKFTNSLLELSLPCDL